MADKCPKARRIVQAVFATPLADIIIGYYAPVSDDNKVIGEHGVYEQCVDERGVAIMAWSELFVPACKMGYIKIVEALLRKRPRPIDDRILITNGLHHAAARDHTDIIELLLLQPYDIGLEPILYSACLSGSSSAVRILLPQISSREPKWTFAYLDASLSVADRMLVAGIPYLNVFLSVVCTHGNDEIVAMLVNAGATGCICGHDISEHPYTRPQVSRKSMKRRMDE